MTQYLGLKIWWISLLQKDHCVDGVCSIRVFHITSVVLYFYRLQGGIEAEKEEREKWINKDIKKMMDSAKGIIICTYNNNFLTK